jgi:putative DNA primase/helicase
MISHNDKQILQRLISSGGGRRPMQPPERFPASQLQTAYGNGNSPDVKAYIRAVETRARMRSVPRTGWYAEPNGRRVFVTPDRVIGESRTGGEGVIFQSDSFDDDDRMVQKGSLADWQSHVGCYCIGNNLLTFATSASFAAPVMRLLGEHSSGFHLVSQSSKGKTTALEVAASIWGHKKGTWDITKNQLENVLECHNDVLLTLDELKLVDPRYAGETVYMISNDGGTRHRDRTSKTSIRGV